MLRNLNMILNGGYTHKLKAQRPHTPYATREGRAETTITTFNMYTKLLTYPCCNKNYCEIMLRE